MPEKVIVCFGDATNDGSLAEHERWPARLRARLNAAGSGTYRVIDAEETGLTTDAALPRIQNRVAFHRPHLVTIRFGTSDSRGSAGAPPTPLDRFEANQRAIAQLIREWTGAITVFMTAPSAPYIHLSGADDPTRAYHDVTRRVAYELNAPLLDMETGLAEAGSARGEQPVTERTRVAARYQELYGEIAARFLKRLV